MAIKQQNDHVAEKQAAKTKTPAMYKVLLLNDDYTPMEFVVDVIMRFFNKDYEQATQIMLQVHTEGAGVCGVFSKDLAETKHNQVAIRAKEYEHPLQCRIQEA